MSSVKLDIKKCLSLITEQDKERLTKWLENEKIKEAIDNGDWKFLYRHQYIEQGYPVRASLITIIISSIGVDLLKEIKDIESYMFEELYIDSINIDSSTSSIGYRAFQKSQFSNSSITIPKGVVLRWDSFSESNVSNVTIDSELDQTCFSRCSDLKTVEIGPNTTSIPNKCFIDCVNLESVKIDDSLPIENVTKNAFDGCTNLKHIEYQGQVFTSVNQFRNYIRDKKNGKRVVTSSWYRINNGYRGYGSYILTCHPTKTKGIVASMIPPVSSGPHFCPLFFKSEKDAKKFIKNNPNEFGRFSNLSVYEARLDPVVDVGFIKVNTNLGTAYIQSHKADDLNLQPGTYTIEV